MGNCCSGAGASEPKSSDNPQLKQPANPDAPKEEKKKVKPNFEVVERSKVKKPVAPGEENTKTWTIKNTGEKPIPEGSKLIQKQGPEDTAIEMTPLGKLKPGESIEFSITFNSAAEPGHHKHVWRICGPKGRRFGPRLGCNYTVVEAEEE